MALTAIALGYRYGAGTRFASEALRDVELAVAPGQVLLVAGETGSGKSTLLRLLAGLLEPSAGSVAVDGVAPTSPAGRGRVAIVFQNPESQFFAETVLDDVAFGPRNMGRPDPRGVAAEALVSVGLDPADFGPRSPFTLSGGEARRAAIAGALALGAPYLLLDEPTAGLDPMARREVVSAVRRERQRSGVVVVTHDPEDFLPEADRILVLEGGRPVVWGAIDELLAPAADVEHRALRLPEFVRAQLVLRGRGADVPRIALEPRDAAAVMLDTMGWSR